MPAYDYRAKIVGEMTPEIDSLLRIEKRRDIFKPCQKMSYRVIYKDSLNQVISDEIIKITPTGNRWKIDPEKQDEILIEYSYDSSKLDIIESHFLNQHFTRFDWQRSEITGITENVEKVWMHPFRSNQYHMTEILPFPQVVLPIRIGKKWTDSEIDLSDYPGEWKGLRVRSRFEVVAKESVKTPYADIDSCWKIEASSQIPLGTSYMTYWFHETFGFIKFESTNYIGQSLDMELIQVEMVQ